ncbi:MAG: aminotransferase class I/II-fold pyridoxal phosphate-dependent enzyme [Bacteroidota bacterium]
MKFETRAIRIQTERSSQREHSTPLYPTSSFVFNSAEQMQAVFDGQEDGNIYSRFTNPNIQEFENKMASLEGVEKAVATSSGMAAVFTSILSFLKQGDHLLACGALFGSTHQIISENLKDYGIEVSVLDPNDFNNWKDAVKTNSKMLLMESPSNPGLNVYDLNAINTFCKEYKLLFNIDNCFATPYLQNPASYGADIITHSATKFIDGQGRVLGGVVAGSSALMEKVFTFIRRTGASLSPFNAWVLSKSLETLSVRMDKHCANALSLAMFLEEHPLIENVRYPFLPSHPDYNIAKKQMRLGGGIVTFTLKEGNNERGIKFLNNLKMLSLTANLGDTRSIASHPASTTHRKLDKISKKKIGISDGLIRISVGLEHIDDIKNDINQALNSI